MGRSVSTGGPLCYSDDLHCLESSPHLRGCSQGFRFITTKSRSSPRPRGLSAVPADRRRRRRVVPAPAGVAPRSGPTTSSAARRPRASGCSVSVFAWWTRRRSSPRPRGLLGRRRRVHPGADVVPAPAGVVRGTAQSPTASMCRPHACGGCSSVVTHIHRLYRSSPRPRGLLDDELLGLGRGTVVRRGLLPASPGPGPGPARRPRARGGCSLVPAPVKAVERSSPRPWGLPGGLTVRRPARPVVPAPAGVARGARWSSRTATCRPHVRGGCSGTSTDTSEGPGSSPRSRGGELVDYGARDVAPAPAGVARTTASARPGTGGRSRVRRSCSI